MRTLKLETQATVQARLQVVLSNFVLQNLATQGVISWQEAWVAHLTITERFGLRADSADWQDGRVDIDSSRSLGLRLSRRIECEDCGRCFGHKTWHAGTPNRADVWECPTNHSKRGTSRTLHIYQTVLLVTITKTFQSLLSRDMQIRSDVAANIADASNASSQRIERAVHDVMTDDHPVLHLPDFLSVFEGACVLTDHRLGFVFTTGDVVTLNLPVGWTPTRQ